MSSHRLAAIRRIAWRESGYRYKWTWDGFVPVSDLCKILRRLDHHGFVRSLPARSRKKLHSEERGRHEDW